MSEDSDNSWRQRAADAEKRALAIQEESDKRWREKQNLEQRLAAALDLLRRTAEFLGPDDPLTHDIDALLEVQRGS